MLEDNYRHQGLRRKLVESIRNKGIKDEAVLKAINEVPRHLFLDSSFLEYAYEDKPFAIGWGQTISQPYTVAFQTQLLNIKKGDKVLEIGTGSGYQACVLSEMGAKVFTIERIKPLYLKTKSFLTKLNYFNIKIFYGDGYKGLPAYAPFDKILVTAGAPDIPQALKAQLKIGGIIVIPVGHGHIQDMIKATKKTETEFDIEKYGKFSFVPLLENKDNGTDMLNI
ncbi:MAG TPA: protein-L-isoaspartate(D-aspartate) O-methyltransferase [Bacteroidales bacterium]|nr:protein-L-isoaspartate(D-aspartate) O-methyltransferase [Bacteroidales bacterium]